MGKHQTRKPFKRTIIVIVLATLILLAMVLPIKSHTVKLNGDSAGLRQPARNVRISMLRDGLNVYNDAAGQEDVCPAASDVIRPGIMSEGLTLCQDVTYRLYIL